MIKKILLTAFVIAITAILAIGGINRTRAILSKSNTSSLTHDADTVRARRGGEVGGQNRQFGIIADERAGAVEWVTYQGTASAVDDNILSVTTTTGETITIENRAWWFAQEQGLQVSTGDALRLTGFIDTANHNFETVQLDNLTNGQVIRLRDENGRPLWAAGGVWAK